MNRTKLSITLVLVVIVIGLFAFRSKWFGAGASAGAFYPRGFAGESAAEKGERTHAVVDRRADGTPVFTADPVRFEDTDGSIRTIERPMVTLAEARRQGIDPDSQTATVFTTYIMRGPMSAGFSEADAQWLLETFRRHENAQIRTKAIGFVAFALLNNHEYDADTWTDATESELMSTFESAVAGDAGQDMQAAALRQAEWQGWADFSPTFVESLQGVATGGGPNAESADTILRHVFLKGGDE